MLDAKEKLKEAQLKQMDEEESKAHVIEIIYFGFIQEIYEKNKQKTTHNRFRI
jgi:hypothetical protein